MTTFQPLPCGDGDGAAVADVEGTLDDVSVVLIVPARERPATARKLLAAAAEAGLDPRVVESISDGYIVPPRVAVLADMILGIDDWPPPSAEAVPRRTGKKAAK